MIRKRIGLFTPIACLLATCLFIGSILPATAQTRQGGVSVKTIIGMVDSFNTKLPSEKLFLHFDKPYYAVGDTMWFKAYLFQGASNTWSPLSGLLYIELISDSDKLVRRMSFPIGYGISWGQIPLIPDDIAAGRYTVYAYTNWMQNAGPAGFFHQRFAIGDAADKYWLVKESHKVNAGDITLAVQLNGADDKPARQKEVRVKVMDGKKTLYKDDVQTGSDGSFRAGFTLPSKTSPSGITLVAEDKTDPTLKVLVPLTINRPENIDLQFMPESGYLVAGLPARVGFKAVGENGKGVDLQGKIVDSREKEVLSFASVHKGMGAFEYRRRAKPIQPWSYSRVAVRFATRYPR